MGNEISTVGGAIATAATSVAVGVTFGQVPALNNAVKDCAQFTADKSSQTIVRHAAETTAHAVSTVAATTATGVTFGQVEVLNNVVKDTFTNTCASAATTCKETVQVLDNYSNAIPVVGHAKGAICYACGDKERGDRAMKSSSRSVGVVAGGVGGALIDGPVGAIVGGLAGGAAMDGVTTGIDSLVHGEFRPNGQIRAWHDGITSDDKNTRIGGLIDVTIVIPAFDAIGSRGAPKLVQQFEIGGMITDQSSNHDVSKQAMRSPLNPLLLVAFSNNSIR